jgi:hypothetical protein
MAKLTLADRVTALEKEVARLKEITFKTGSPAVDWLGVIWASFANDPMYDEAMRLGREYRESSRTKTRKRRMPSAVRERKER